MKLIDFAFCQR